MPDNLNLTLELLAADDLASRPERADAAANRARILEKAEELFAAHDVPAVSMADIAEAAGVGKGTLYRRFANKGELCLALMDTQLRTFQDDVLARLRELVAGQVSYLSQLDFFLEELVYFTSRHYPLLCEVQQHTIALDDGTNLLRPHYWQYMTVYGLLEQAIRAGELPAGVDIAYLAEALLAPLSPNTFRFQQEILNFPLERIVNGLQTIVAALRTL